MGLDAVGASGDTTASELEYVVSPESVETSRLFSTYRLQVARQARGLTKSELSKRINVSAAALSQFELGQARPSPATVERMAAALEFTPTFFSTGRGLSPISRADDELVDSFGHFRSLRSVTATKRRQVLTVAHLLRDVTACLDTHVRLPALDVPRCTAVTDESIAEAASFVRSELGVDGDGPVDDVLRLLERAGVVCARYPIEAADVSAFSVPMDRHTFLVLKQQRRPRKDRDRFSSSHELGHLVLHQPDQRLASRALEREADLFASAFLMPASGIRDELPSKVEWPYLLQLKQKWGVSVAALLRRSRDLGVMDDATYTQAVKTMSARGWRTDEPGTVTSTESPALLSTALSVAKLTISNVSDETGWPEPMIGALFGASTDGRPTVKV